MDEPKQRTNSKTDDTPSPLQVYLQEGKPKWFKQQFWADFRQQQGGAPVPRRITIADYYRYLDDADAAFTRSHGLEKTLGDVLRPPAYALLENPCAGPRIKRGSQWPGATYTNPFWEVYGARSTVFFVDFEARKPSRQFLSHLGEEFCFLDKGSLSVRFIDRKMGLAPRRCDLSENDDASRCCWWKSEVPHQPECSENANAKVLVAFADPIGETVLIGTEDDKHVSASGRWLEEATPERDKLVAVSGVGGRIVRARIMSGLSAAELATRCRLQAYQLSHIETGRASPSLETLVTIAAELNAAVTDILPDDVIDYVHGFWSPTHDTNHRPCPYWWRDHGKLVVFLAGSPLAKVLVPMIIVVGGDQDTDLARQIGRYNMKYLAGEGSDFVSYAEYLVVYILCGRIKVHVFPHVDARFPYDIQEGMSESKVLEAGNLFHLRTRHRHRFEPVSNDCKLLCVLWRNPGYAQTAIQRPTQSWLHENKIGDR